MTGRAAATKPPPDLSSYVDACHEVVIGFYRALGFALEERISMGKPVLTPVQGVSA